MDNLVRTSACTEDAPHGILAQNATVGHLIAQVNLSREEIAEALEALAVKQRVILKDGESWSLAPSERLRFDI
jgi:hypothetical protein